VCVWVHYKFWLRKIRYYLLLTIMWEYAISYKNLWHTWNLVVAHQLQNTVLEQCDPTGGPWATTGPRPLVARPAKLFVNLLLVTTSSFIFFAPKDVKKSVILISSAALHASATHAIAKPYYRMQVFQVNTVSDISCCRNKFKIICKCSNLYTFQYNLHLSIF
jgi:hypothetical protein